MEVLLGEPALKPSRIRRKNYQTSVDAIIAVLFEMISISKAIFTNSGPPMEQILERMELWEEALSRCVVLMIPDPNAIAPSEMGNGENTHPAVEPAPRGTDNTGSL